MKRLSISAVLLPLAMAVSTLVSAAPDNLTTLEQKTGYAMGYNFAEAMLSQGWKVDPDALQSGLMDGIKKATPALSEEARSQVLTTAQKAMTEERLKKADAAKARNKAAAAAFLAENGKKPGVKTTASGLQYEVLVSGKGASPKKTDSVKANYHGTLLDGSVFDSTKERGQPATFQVDRVIAGWAEALPLMKVGDRWRLAIPPELAYGDRGVGGKIEPGMALIFDVELLEIVPAAK
jgi:FKBP-type peptidyl-prolyl cis-trans isomerase FklB